MNLLINIQTFSQLAAALLNKYDSPKGRNTNDIFYQDNGVSVKISRTSDILNSDIYIVLRNSEQVLKTKNLSELKSEVL